MFRPHDSVLGCHFLASSKRLGAYPTRSKIVLVDIVNLGLCGRQSLGDFNVLRVVRVADLYQVL